MELVIASTNIHKIRELRALLKPFQFDVLSLFDFPGYIPPEETGSSFQENAELKAKNAAQTFNRLALSDDSGLVVPSLQGLPGVHSARYAGPAATDRENCMKLLINMKHLQESNRAAYFECAISLASPDGLLRSFQGVCEGMIL